jgi:hypothetical protein
LGYDGRASAKFRDVAPREGKPVDIAIYVGNIIGDIHVNNTMTVINSIGNQLGAYGGIVVDAQNNITFGSTFVDYLKGKNLDSSPHIDWLEVCSRNVTHRDLNQVILEKKLPYANDLGSVSSWFGYSYVLRGDWAGSILNSTTGAEVLAMTTPISIVVPIGFAPDKSLTEIKDDSDVKKFLAEEFGGERIQSDDAYKDVQATDMKISNQDARKLMAYAAVLRNEEKAAAFSNLDFAAQVPPSKEQNESRAVVNVQNPQAEEWLVALGQYSLIIHINIGYSEQKTIALVDEKYIRHLSGKDAKDFAKNYIHAILSHP